MNGPRSHFKQSGDPLTLPSVNMRHDGYLKLSAKGLLYETMVA